MMKAIVFSLAVLLLGIGVALGQDYYGADYRASTVGESHARGMSDMARSAGERNLSNSQAAINMTQAQSNHIQNREQWTHTYFEMRAANRAYRAAARGPKPTMEDVVRYAQAGKPKRLSPSQLDYISGGINWPPLLDTEPFATYREELEPLFAQRASAGTTTWDVRTKIDEATDGLLAELKGKIRELPPSDYMAAKRFVEGLAHEAKLPTG